MTFLELIMRFESACRVGGAPRFRYGLRTDRVVIFTRRRLPLTIEYCRSTTNMVMLQAWYY